MAEETPNPNQNQAAELDAATLAFLELVDCQPTEVRDIPEDRRWMSHEGFDQPNLKSLGHIEVWFGKHKGKQIKDLPADYLAWLINQPRMDIEERGIAGSVEKFKRQVRQYLELLFIENGVKPAYRTKIKPVAFKPKPRPKKQKKRPKQEGGKTGYCRNCGAAQAGMHKYDWYKANPPRCQKCGGILDRRRERGF